MQEKIKHVVFFTPGFPASEDDLNCVASLQNYVKSLSEMHPEIRVTVIAFQYPHYKATYLWHGITVYSVGGKNKKYFSRLLIWLHVLKIFIRVNKNRKVDIIHCFWLTECTFVAQWVHYFFKVKVIGYLLGQDCLTSNRYLKWLHYTKIKIVSASEFADKLFFSVTGFHSHHIISLGLDADRFVSKINDNPTIDILGVGNLQSVKNYSLFIDIIGDLAEEFPNIKAIIAGEGEEFDILNSRITDMKLTHNISLKGRVEREQIISMMQNSRIFLHTSSHEGQGYVFDEALYSGMSIVAFEVGNLKANERIRICQSKEDMISQLKLLLTNPPPRNKILRKSIQQTVDDFMDVYNS